MPAERKGNIDTGFIDKTASKKIGGLFSEMSCNKIGPEEMRRQVDEILRKSELLKKHPYSIYYYEKEDCWFTHVADPVKGGRRRIRSKTKEGLYASLSEIYSQEEETSKCHTLEDVYQIYRKEKNIEVDDNTVLRYDNEHDRHAGDPIWATDITRLGEFDIKQYVFECIEKRKLRKRAVVYLVNDLKNTFNKAIAREIYTKPNPFTALKTRVFTRRAYDPPKPDSERLIDPDDLDLLYKALREDHEKKPYYIVPYAVEFSMLTGARPGEISGLMWDCVDFKNGQIHIIRREKFHKRTKEYSIETTKNDKWRIIPMTTALRGLLGEVLEATKRFGFYNGEFVFTNESGRIHLYTISCCVKNKSIQAGTSRVYGGVYFCRRTVNSNLRAGDMSSVEAGTIIGNSPAVNDKYYTFNTATLEERRRKLESVNRGMIGTGYTEEETDEYSSEKADPSGE